MLETPSFMKASGMTLKCVSRRIVALAPRDLCLTPFFFFSPDMNVLSLLESFRLSQEGEVADSMTRICLKTYCSALGMMPRAPLSFETSETCDERCKQLAKRRATSKASSKGGACHGTSSLLFSPPRSSSLLLAHRFARCLPKSSLSAYSPSLFMMHRRFAHHARPVLTSLPTSAASAQRSWPSMVWVLPVPVCP